MIAECEARTVRSGSLMTDARWLRFGSRAGHLGVHSALAIPLQSPAGVLGVMNVYAHRRDAFDDHAWLLGEQFAAPAAVAVHNAQVLSQARRLVLQLQRALAHRAVIDQAIGIVRSRHGGSADDASDWLRHASRAQNQDLRTVAQGVLDGAVRQAHAGHGQDLGM
jgi:GAF domain-containing protein